MAQVNQTDYQNNNLRGSITALGVLVVLVVLAIGVRSLGAGLGLLWLGLPTRGPEAARTWVL